MRGALIVAALAACGGTRPRVVVANDSVPPAPAKAKGSAARVAHYSIAWIRLDADPIRADPPVAANEVWPVTDVTDDRVRVRVDADGARLRVWMPRSDLQPVIVRDTRLAIDGAPHGTSAGVVAHPGAMVRGQNGAGATIAGDGLVAVGAVPPDAIGDLWTPVDRSIPSANLDLFPGDVVRAAPDAHAVLLASVEEQVPAHQVGERDGWTEVIVGGPLVTVHGFIPTPPPGDYGGTIGSGIGSGYGMSDTMELDVPQGACLYDREGGDAIGVELATQKRYAYPTDDPTWFEVYVGTPWGLGTVAYHVGVTCP